MAAGPNPPGNQPKLGESLEQALDALEQGLQSAVHAIEQIRSALAADDAQATPPEAGALRLVPPMPIDPVQNGSEEGLAPLHEREDDPYTPFERLWERMEHERVEKARQNAAGEPELHGLELLPQLYLVTVEDRDRRVDLVPLHRALLGIEAIEEITLASYANGVPVVSLRAKRAIDLEQLRGAIESTLRRACEVIPQDTGRIFLRLTSPEKIGV